MVQINIDDELLKDVVNSFLKDEQAIRELSTTLDIPYEYLSTQEGSQWMILGMIMGGIGGGM